MKAALIRFFSSLKVWTTLLGLTVLALAHWGINVDANTQAEIAGLFAVLLGAQGLADHGKEAALINAKNPPVVVGLPNTLPDVSPAPASATAPAKAAVVMLSILVLGSGLTMNGCSHDARATTIKTALISADALEAGFLAWDRQHELDLVASATSPGDATTKLDAYHAKRSKVDLVFALYFKAVAVASQLNDDHSVASIALAAIEVEKTIADLKNGGTK